MLRMLRIIGAAYLALTVVAIVVRRALGPSSGSDTSSHATSMSDTARWFELTRPSCKASEIDRKMMTSPPPPGEVGAAFAAGCYALAGKSERAHELLEALPPERRGPAAAHLLEVVRSDADGFADPASTPLLELMLEYVPDHVDGLYRAAMAELASGDAKAGERHLRRFVDLTSASDPRREKALAKLRDLGASSR